MKRVHQSNNRRSTFGIQESHLCNEASTSKKSLFMVTADRIQYRMIDNENNNTLSPESLNLILGKTWRIFRTTKFNNLVLNYINLKRYAVFIKQALIKEIKDENANITFQVKITTLRTEETDANILQIEVHVVKDKFIQSCKYRGFIILSWDCNDSDPSQLSLLLCMGTVSVIKIVHAMLFKLFDTLIQPLLLSAEDLMWISAIECSYITEERSKKIVFKYSIPKLKTTNCITISPNYSGLCKLWNKVHTNKNNEITFEEINTYFKLLHTQFILAYGIRFDLLKLHEITFPDMSLTTEGRLKVKTEDSAIKVLSFINEIAQILDNPCPSMSYEHKKQL